MREKNNLRNLKSSLNIYTALTPSPLYPCNENNIKKLKWQKRNHTIKEGSEKASGDHQWKIIHTIPRVEFVFPQLTYNMPCYQFILCVCMCVSVSSSAAS